MIKKLRSAGLGFYVRETDTQQKLGLKLRQTLYSVTCSPHSYRKDPTAGASVQGD